LQRNRLERAARVSTQRIGRLHTACASAL